MSEDAPVTVLNWGINSKTPATLGYKAQRCINCGWWALVINPQGRPQHKVCAEKIAREAGLLDGAADE